jgi:hypothetical protein
MSMKFKSWVLAAGALGSVLLGAAPAMAEGHGGGGGGHAGGGGHFGGGAHVSGGGAHFGGAAHFSGGAHYASAGHYGAGYPAASHGYPAGFHGSSVAGYHGGYSGAYYGHGYSTGAYWRGGYWGGGFWPRAYYGVGFSWFLPVLPLAYATYWWGGVPYYYANDVYYTYNPSYDGYVATDPPPVSDPNATADASGAPPAAAPSAAPAPAAGGPVAGQIFMYPKNGQSPEQQATDKAECQQWAAQQAGQVAQNATDYQRAMSTCVEGRGYSAR